MAGLLSLSKSRRRYKAAICEIWVDAVDTFLAMFSHVSYVETVNIRAKLQFIPRNLKKKAPDPEPLPPAELPRELRWSLSL